MNVLDENIPLDQCELLRAWHIGSRVIGRDVSQLSVHDDNITVLLHRLKKPTFFTRDEDFFKSNLCHRRYCIVFLDVRPQSRPNSLAVFFAIPASKPRLNAWVSLCASTMMPSASIK